MIPFFRYVQPWISVYIRVALGTAFLSAVADRWGGFGPPGAANVAWGTFDQFLSYTAQLNPYLPTGWIPALGGLVTGIEVVLGLALIIGFQTRAVAWGSGLLLLAFALAMSLSLGVKAPLDYSVFTASASAFLLATLTLSTCCASSRVGTPHKAGKRSAMRVAS